MERVLKFLEIEGFKNVPSDLHPDGKLNKVPSDARDTLNTAYFVVYENFGTKTGEKFYTLVYGDATRGMGAKSFTTLENPAGVDRAVVNRRIKHGTKMCEEYVKQLMSAAKADIETMCGEELPEASPVPPGMWLHALGFKEKEYFYSSSNNKQVVAISRFSEADMLNLMPIEYWELMYPGAGQSRVDWTTAKSSIMQQAREVGIFQSRRIRGAGVWHDAGRTIVNMGDHLLVNGERVELGDIDSRYFYTLGETLPTLHEAPLEADDCNILIDACSTFKWIKPEFSFLMAGALVTSRVCGALPVRPHVWITGGASTGKSTLLERLIRPIIGTSVVYAIRGTTEAGIRQRLKANAVPLIYDEFETTTARSAEVIDGCVELLRCAWSESDAMVIKGSSSGNSESFQVRCAAIVSSIRTRLMNDADASRFARVELKPHESDAPHWEKLSDLLSQIDVEYGERLFSRSIKMIPVLLRNFKTLKSILAARVGARFGDQYGMLLAGYSILLQDDALTVDEATALVDAVRLNEEREEAKTTDHEDALDHFLSTQIMVLNEKGERDHVPVSGLISDARFDSHLQKELQKYGIQVTSSDVIVATRHAELESKVFRGTRWSGGWSNAFMRLPGASRTQTRFCGKSMKAVRMPISSIIN